MNGLEGDCTELIENGYLEELDQKYAAELGSNYALDITYAHFLERTKGHKGRKICIGIIENMYERCGRKIPETMKRYY